MWGGAGIHPLLTEPFEWVVSGASLWEHALVCLKNPNYLEKQTNLGWFVFRNNKLTKFNFFLPTPISQFWYRYSLMKSDRAWFYMIQSPGLNNLECSVEDLERFTSRKWKADTTENEWIQVFSFWWPWLASIKVCWLSVSWHSPSSSLHEFDPSYLSGRTTARNFRDDRGQRLTRQMRRLRFNEFAWPASITLWCLPLGSNTMLYFLQARAVEGISNHFPVSMFFTSEQKIIFIKNVKVSAL